MVKTNKDKLVEISVVGEIASPLTGGIINTYDGQAKILPQVGGITYNVKVGDYAMGLQADHVEPGVSITNKEPVKGYRSANDALNIYSCVGNEARVITGDAKGDKGIVTGKHGGIEHVIIDFPDETLENMAIGDKIQIKAYGTGLELPDFPHVKAMNIDPKLLDHFIVKRKHETGILLLKVASNVHAKFMGSGLGSTYAHRGDYDVQTFDPKAVKDFKLDKLRFGDLVAIIDADHSYGRIYKEGAMSIGVVVHSDCVMAGHGPGIMTILTTSKPGGIENIVDRDANIGKYLNIGRYRTKKK
ncbi:MAG: DUF4438 domain-containing protein [Nanoarchaeota archaeon]|nr:DUF4438 domain-containing protein [Nanoarchaeota archaeon]MCG2718550.1 DUF4438 domain-containing protein [Nanoarchaeota archaeon]